MEFRTQVRRDWDGRKRILFAFIILQKCRVLFRAATNDYFDNQLVGRLFLFDYSDKKS